MRTGDIQRDQTVDSRYGHVDVELSPDVGWSPGTKADALVGLSFVCFGEPNRGFGTGDGACEIGPPPWRKTFTAEVRKSSGATDLSPFLAFRRRILRYHSPQSASGIRRKGRGSSKLKQADS